MKTTPTTGTPTTGGGSPVTIAEIADFLRHLRNLSRPPTPDGANPDGTERAVFLARKADLFARIAAQHPELLPHIAAFVTIRRGRELSRMPIDKPDPAERRAVCVHMVGCSRVPS